MREQRRLHLKSLAYMDFETQYLPYRYFYVHPLNPDFPYGIYRYQRYHHMAQLLQHIQGHAYPPPFGAVMSVNWNRQAWFKPFNVLLRTLILFHSISFFPFPWEQGNKELKPLFSAALYIRRTRIKAYKKLLGALLRTTPRRKKKNLQPPLLYAIMKHRAEELHLLFYFASAATAHITGTTNTSSAAPIANCRPLI